VKCVKGTGYGEYENDFYGQLEEIVQIDYPGIPVTMMMRRRMRKKKKKR
jgi:hypothetical protein